MATAAAFLRKLKAISLPHDAGPIIDKHMDELYSTQTDQLEQGVGADGRPLMSILNDPYFKTKAQAWAYAEFKQAVADKYGFVTPFGQPNLFINGYTHSSLHISRSGFNVRFSFSVPWAAELDQKYKGQELGLNPDSKAYFWNKILKHELLVKYSKALGCKIVAK